MLDYDIFVYRLSVYIPGYSSSHFSVFRAHPSYRDCDRCNFQCGECHFKTSYKLNLKRHMEIHMTAKSKMYVCPECGKSLGSIRTLRGHVKQRHPAKALAIDKTFRIPDSVYFHFCEICRMAFSTPDDKERHLKYVHEDITPKDLRDYALSKQKERIRTSNLPAYGGYLCCSICSETVQSYPELQRHQNIHRGHTEVIERLNSLGINITANGVNSNNGSAQSIDQVQAIKSNSEKRSYSNTASTTSCSIILTKHNRFQCDKCDASFRALYRLKRHISQTHEKIRNCLCEFCGKLYSTLEIVRNHIRAKHEKIKPVNCDFCNKKVTSRTAINSHMQNHFGLQKKFTCEICGKVCLGFGSYKNHRQGHEGDFICKCGQKFRNRQTLTYHEKTKHGKNPFICTTCQKTFSNPTSLNIHERIHRDDKRHKCQTCRKSFVQHYSLTVHMRVHTQEKPFRCNKCDARYTQSYPLTLHKRKHHGL